MSETRTITLPEHADWGYLELVLDARVAEARHEARVCRDAEEELAARQYDADAELDETILNALRSARA